MAVVKGINCGFVTSAPTDDPDGEGLTFDSTATAFKDIAPTGATHITEIGWYCGLSSGVGDSDVGIYSHDNTNNKPDVLLSSTTFSKDNSTGWKKATGLNIPVTAGVIYWIAAQLDVAAGLTDIDYNEAGGEKMDRKLSQTSLTNPWGTSNSSHEFLLAVYAVWEEVIGPFPTHFRV